MAREACWTSVFEPKSRFFAPSSAETDGRVTTSCCSQWFPTPFKIDGVEYLTAEHYMMAAKARLFNHSEMLQNVLACLTPKEAKAFGRKVRNFEGDVCKNHCTQILIAANHAKFTKNPALAEWLVASAPKVLVEASLWDRIWGIGMAQSNPKALDPSQWKGQNLLGFALMQVRDQLSKIN